MDFLLVSILFIIVVSTATAIQFRIPTLSHFYEAPQKKLDSIVNIRAGKPGDNLVWYYSGVIRNPLTGGEVVGIEGLELTRAISNNDIQSSNSTKNDSRTNLSSQRAFLSRKVFIYTDSKNRSEPLRSHRIRKHSPLRQVTPVKVLHELITFGSQKNGNGNIFATVEFPGGRTVHSGSMSVTGDEGLLTMLPWARRKFELTCFMLARRKRTVSKWVSFAPTSDGSGRSQEYHSYAYDGPLKKASVQCRRFGECPAWFAPGRSCSTELTATRYSSLRAVPKDKLLLFRRECPDFFLVPLSLKTFRNSTDLVSNYKPWYSRLPLFITPSQNKPPKMTRNIFPISQTLTRGRWDRATKTNCTLKRTRKEIDYKFGQAAHSWTRAQIMNAFIRA
eukprot:gene3073-6025_t